MGLNLIWGSTVSWRVSTPWKFTCLRRAWSVLPPKSTRIPINQSISNTSTWPTTQSTRRMTSTSSRLRIKTTPPSGTWLSWEGTSISMASTTPKSCIRSRTSWSKHWSQLSHTFTTQRQGALNTGMFALSYLGLIFYWIRNSNHGFWKSTYHPRCQALAP